MSERPRKTVTLPDAFALDWWWQDAAGAWHQAASAAEARGKLDKGEAVKTARRRKQIMKAGEYLLPPGKG